MFSESLGLTVLRGHARQWPIEPKLRRGRAGGGVSAGAGPAGAAAGGAGSWGGQVGQSRRGPAGRSLGHSPASPAGGRRGVQRLPERTFQREAVEEQGACSEVPVKTDPEGPRLPSAARRAPQLETTTHPNQRHRRAGSAGPPPEGPEALLSLHPDWRSLFYPGEGLSEKTRWSVTSLSPGWSHLCAEDSWCKYFQGEFTVRTIKTNRRKRNRTRKRPILSWCRRTESLTQFSADFPGGLRMTD